MKIRAWIFIMLVFLVILNIAHSQNEIKAIEGELVDLFPEVDDPDADKLIYKFSPPLDKNGKWQTAYGSAGAYNITISVFDGQTEVSENVTLIVAKKEEPPAITKIEPELDSLDIKENDKIKFKVTANDLNNDPLDYVWLLDDTEVSRDTSIIFHPDYDDSGSYKLAVRISDGTNVVSKQWDVNVINVDMPPIFLPIEPITINENEQVVISLNATDPDGDTVEFEVQNMPEGAVFEGSTFTWTPSYNAVSKDSLANIILDKYHLLSKSFEINFIAKSNNLFSEQRAIIKVRDINMPPIMEELSDIVMKEGESFIIVPKANDPDGDKLSFRYSGWINTDRKQTGFDDDGMHKVTVIVSDGEHQFSKDVNITVLNVNRKPVFNPIKQAEVRENETLIVHLSADDPDNDYVSFYLDNKNNFSDLEINGNILKWGLSFDVADKNQKDVKIGIIASDSEFNATQELAVMVFDVNRAPEIVSVMPDKNSFAYSGDKTRFEVLAKDPDNDKLTYTWKLGTFEKYKGKNALLRRFNDLGRKRVSVVVSDGEKSAEFEWNVHVIKKPKKGR